MSANRSIGVYKPRSRRAQFADALASFQLWLKDMVLETLRRTVGVLLILFAIVLVGALLSYDSADPSLNVATGRDAGNWLGAAGAFAADFLLELFGVAAFLLP